MGVNGMTTRHRNTKSGHIGGAQFDLYRLVKDGSVAQEQVGRSSEQGKNAEEIEMHNRSVAARTIFVFKKHHATSLH